MKIRKKIRSIAVILFTVILTLNSVSAEASGLRITKELDEREFVTPSDDEILEHIGGDVTEPARPMKDESPTHAYRRSERIIKNATCTQSGRKQIVCGVAGCTIHGKSEETIPPLGHSLDYVYIAPTESSTGWEGYKCTRSGCSYKNGTTIPRLAHEEKPDKPSTPSDPQPGSGSGSGGGSGSGSGNNSGSGSGNQGGNGGNNNSGQGTGNTSQTTQKTSTKATQLEATNVTTTSGGDPVDLFTGAHEIDFVVLSQSGVSDITVALSYKSNKSIDGVFGKGFYWNYESFLKEENGKILLYHSPCEFVEYEKKDGASVYVTKAKGSKLDELNKNADGSFTLKSNEKVFDYNKEGKLVKVTQKTKESVSIEYKSKETVLHDDLSGQTISLLFNDKGQVVKVTNNATAEATFEYSDTGYLTKYTDADGFATEYTFDEEGRVLTGKDADGNVFFTDFYDEKGRVKEQKDALGNLSTFEYKEIESTAQDKTNVIVKETILKDREGNAEVSSFDEAGRLLKTVDEEGNITLKEYDKEGNLIKSTDALGNVTLSEYDEKDNLIKSTDAEGSETKYEYDENRNVTKITFPDGSVNTFIYDAKNRLLSLTDQRGLVTENDYYENGLLKSSKKGNQITNYTYENGEIKTIEDSLGNVTTLDYDENGHLVNTEDALGAKTKLSVSPFGAVTATTDAYGNTKSFTLSPFDKPLKVTDEEGNVATNEYDERQLLKASIDNKGNRTEYFYDKEERLVKTVFPDGTFTENEYDKTGKLLLTTDALGNKTSFSYDANGNVLKETDKEGNEISFTYNAKGQVLSKTDSKGNVTSFSYDSMGRKVTETNALGGVTKYSYNTAGNLVSIEDAMGNVTSFTYDEYGRKVSETDPNGNTTTFKYDLNGNLVETINALGESTFYKYDSLNRLIKTSVVDDAHSVEIAYDLNGRVVSETDPNGNTTRRVYDKRGNVSKVIDALGYETLYVYDKNGNLISSTNAKGQTISYEINSKNQITKITDALNLESILSYDNNGRLKSVVNPMGGVSENIFDKKGNVLELIGPNGAKTDFTYDSNNNLTSRSTVNGNSVKYTYNALNLADSMTNGRGQNFTYEYDLLGRITKSTSPEGETTYSYDKNSNVLTVTDLNGTITRTYDSLNRVSSVTDTYGNTVSYVYDSYGNLARLIYPDNTAVSYTYDSLGNIKTVTDWEGRVTTYNYDSLNREIECFNANGTKTEKGYDEVGNVVRIAEYKDHGATTLTAETVLEYDQGNRLVKETENVKGISYEYSYDDLSRVLLRKTINTKTGAVTDEETFGYDPAGNIVNSTGIEAKKALSYIAEDNRIDLADGVKFTFDNDGNLISGKLFDKDTTLTYDSKNRLTGFNDDSYVYDAEDYRVKSVIIEEIKSNYFEWIEKPGDSELPIGPIGPGKPRPGDPIIPDPGNPIMSIEESDGTNDESVSLNDLGTLSNDNQEPSDAASIEIIDEEETEEDDKKEESDSESDSGVSEETSLSEEEFLNPNAETALEASSTEEVGTSVSDGEVGSSDVSSNDKGIIDETDTLSKYGLFGNRFDNSQEISERTLGFGEKNIGIDLGDNTEYIEAEVNTEYCYDRLNKNLLVATGDDGKIVKYIYGNGLIATSDTLIEYREDIIWVNDEGGRHLDTVKKEVSRTTEYNTYFYDLRGSVISVTAENGEIKAEYAYSTYGKREILFDESHFSSKLGYCARDGVLTEANGLLYMRARYYSTELMRFINQDIVVGDISNSNSLNRYAYVEGNPATLIDPFGLEPKGTIGKAVKDIYNKAKKSVDDYFNAERLRKIAEILQIVSDGMEIASAVLDEVAKYAGIAGGAAGTATLAAMAASAIVLVIPGVGQVVEVGEFTIGITVTEYCLEISAVSATAAGALQLGESGLSKASNALYEKAAAKEASSAGGNPKTPTSRNQMNKQVESGKAPKGVDRVDGPHCEGQQDHIHFGDNEAALNKDGTWHDAGKNHPNLTNKQQDWITKNGWNLPND